MAEAGYNPVEMAHFFEKLEAEGGARGPQFFSDHPNPGNRVKAVEDEIRYFPQQKYVTGETGQFQRIKSIVAGIPAPPKKTGQQAGPAAAPARAPGEIRPSSRFKEVRGRNFSLQYPDNWRTFGDNQTNNLTLAPEEAVFQTSGSGVQIGYGAIVSYYAPQGSRIDLRRDTDALIRQLSQSNQGVGVQGNRQYRVAGNDALITTLYSRSPYQGEREVDSLVTVARPEGLFYIVFIAPDSEWKAVQPAFEKMLSTIRFQ
jgi:hypothetical protein